MKRSNYILTMVIGIIIIMLMPVTPCRAEWQYLGSYLPNDPPNGSGGDDYSHWEYSCSNSTSADSGGVSASGSCSASTWVSIYVSEGGNEDMTRSVGADCATYGYSYYRDDNPPNWLHVSWSISAGGNVDCSGSVDERYSDGSTYASSSASGGADSYGDYGSGYASGSAWSRDELASASKGLGGCAEGEGFADEYYGEYDAELSYTITGNGYQDFDHENYLTQFTASAYIWAYSSSNGSASLTEGEAYADSESSAYCSGSASTSVSY